MSSEVVGDVTVAIRNLLQQGLGNSYGVTLCSPWDDFGTETGLNIFLYKVEENAQLKNMDWLVNRSNSSKTPISPLSLDLFYLLTPYAPKIETSIADIAINHRILGRAMQILHENPVLNDIHNQYFDVDNDLLFSEELRNSFEKIKIIHNPMDMEGLSKIWAMGDKPYRLSVSYHVSLVQITPSIPAKTVAPPVQEIGLVDVKTFAVPVITKLHPLSGPVGSELHIIGQNLWEIGSRTTVRLGDTTVTNFISLTENEIVFTIPDKLKKGPELEMTVMVNGRESKPELFLVSPWITYIKPQRGAVDTNDTHSVPCTIQGFDFQGVVQMSIGGVAVDTADITVVNKNIIKTYVPHTLGNGYQNIDLNIDGNPANKRIFEVVPLIENIIPAQGPPGGSGNINGQRLNGTEIRISIGPAVIITPANTNPNQISFNVPKTFRPGTYEVKVTIDRHESNIKTFEVIEQP